MILNMGSLLFILLMMLTQSGCMLGPNFQHPAAPAVKRYTTEPLPTKTMSPKQSFKRGQFIPAQWWTVFHSNPLNQLITEALRANPDLQAASAALRVAHENTQVQQAAYFPVISANYNPTRQLTAGTYSSVLASNAYLYTLNLSSLNISYAPDVLGLNRRRVESMLAEEESACFQREAVQLTLTSNLVLAVIEQASLREQIKATQKSIHIAEQMSEMIKKQRSFGQVGEDSVAAQATLLAQTKAALPPLKQQLAQQNHLIASLSGHFPSEAQLHAFSLNRLSLPHDLPLSLPSKLIEQRPDIRAAEAEMHAASARIGVAIANRFPNIILSATGGFAPVDFAANSVPLGFPLLPSGSAGFWGIGANLAGTIFAGGALMHQQRAAVAAYDLSCAQYRRVVLDAFEDVADTLKAIQFDALALKLARDQAIAAKQSFTIVKRKWELGSTNYLEVLNAEQSYQLALINLVQSQASRLADSAALFQALGGGWSNEKTATKAG